MTAKAAYKTKVYALAAADGDSAPTSVGDFTLITSIDSVDFNETRINLEKTALGDTEGARRYFLGLKEGTISLNGFYDAADAGFDEVDTAFEGADDGVCWILIAWTGTPSDGTTKVKCTVSERTRGGQVAERINRTASLNFSGAPSAGPTS